MFVGLTDVQMKLPFNFEAALLRSGSSIKQLVAFPELGG